MRQRFFNPKDGSETNEPMGQERSMRGFTDKKPVAKKPTMRPGSRPMAHHPHDIVGARKKPRIPPKGKGEQPVGIGPNYDGVATDKTPVRPVQRVDMGTDEGRREYYKRVADSGSDEERDKAIKDQRDIRKYEAGHRAYLEKQKKAPNYDGQPADGPLGQGPGKGKTYIPPPAVKGPHGKMPKYDGEPSTTGLYTGSPPNATGARPTGGTPTRRGSPPFAPPKAPPNPGTMGGGAHIEPWQQLPQPPTMGGGAHIEPWQQLPQPPTMGGQAPAPKPKGPKGGATPMPAPGGKPMPAPVPTAMPPAMPTGPATPNMPRPVGRTPGGVGGAWGPTTAPPTRGGVLRRK